MVLGDDIPATGVTESCEKDERLDNDDCVPKISMLKAGRPPANMSLDIDERFENVVISAIEDRVEEIAEGRR